MYLYKYLKLLDIEDLAVVFRQAKDDLNAAKEHQTMMQKQFDLMRHVVMIEKMEEKGVENITIVDVGRISIRAEARASLVDGSKPEAIAWLIENGFESIPQTTVNASTLKALLKEQLQKGLEFPDELFNFTPYSMAVLTKT